MTWLLDFVFNGIVLGSILALAGIGLTLVYGILRLSNFAHGDLLTVGAYTVWVFNALLSLQAGRTAAWTVAGAIVAWLAYDRWGRSHLRGMERSVLAAVAVVLVVAGAWPLLGAGMFGPGFLLGAAMALVVVPALLVLLDRLIWRRLRAKRATVVTLIITSIGLALLLRHLIMWGFGTGLQSYDRPPQPPLALLGFLVTRVQLLTVGTAAVLIGAVHVLLRYTPVGKALRAVSDDPDLARVSGIDVDRMVLYVWVLGGALAALAGILLALNVNVNPNLGWNLILPIFAAVILGGIGSPYGAMLGAFVIAIAMEVSVAWVPQYRLAVGFLLLILVMVLRPQGILGVKR